MRSKNRWRRRVWHFVKHEGWWGWSFYCGNSFSFGFHDFVKIRRTKKEAVENYRLCKRCHAALTDGGER